MRETKDPGVTTHPVAWYTRMVKVCSVEQILDSTQLLEISPCPTLMGYRDFNVVPSTPPTGPRQASALLSVEGPRSCRHMVPLNSRYYEFVKTDLPTCWISFGLRHPAGKKIRTTRINQLRNLPCCFTLAVFLNVY